VLIASDEPTDEAVEFVTDWLTREMRDPLGSSHRLISRIAAETIDLAAQLSNSSTLWVPLCRKPGTDCIVKFSYIDRYDATKAWWKRVLIGCSWRERTLTISLPHSGLHTRYHLDVESPSPGLELMVAKTTAFPGAQATPVLSSPMPNDKHTGPPTKLLPDATKQQSDSHPDARAVSVGPHEGEPTESSRIADGHAHIYHGYRAAPSHRMFLQLRLAASREGFISGCAIAALLIATLMTVAFAKIDTAMSNLDATVVLLAAVPAALGYVLVRPAAHALERHHIAGVRAFAIVAGAIPILASLTITLVVSKSVARGVWAGLVIASWAVALSLGLSWLFAAPASELGRDRRWSRIAPRTGLIVSLGLVAGYALAYQPYSHLQRSFLAHYFISHRGEVIASTVSVGLGAVAFYALVGGLWRLVTTPLRPERNEMVRNSAPRFVRRFASWWWGAMSHRKKGSSGSRTHRTLVRATELAVLGAAVLWSWGTLASLTITAWQALDVKGKPNPFHVAQVTRVADIVANATMLPAAILVAVVTAWLVFRCDLAPTEGASVGVALVALAAFIGLIIRLVELCLFSRAGVNPQVVWFLFALWLGVVAMWLRRPMRMSLEENPVA
jgi:hypothetical protein